MILVDDIRHYPRQIWKQRCRYEDFCHMVSDTSEEELHAFADSLGLKRAWFQDKSLPHYDITPSKRTLALRLGATAVPSRELVTRAWRRPKPETGGQPERGE